MNSLKTEDIWFRTISLIIILFFLIISIVNAYYWNRVRNKSCNGISKSEASGLLWLNIILAIIAGAIFIWAFIRLFFHDLT